MRGASVSTCTLAKGLGVHSCVSRYKVLRAQRSELWPLSNNLTTNEDTESFANKSVCDLGIGFAFWQHVVQNPFVVHSQGSDLCFGRCSCPQVGARPYWSCYHACNEAIVWFTIVWLDGYTARQTCTVPWG